MQKLYRILVIRSMAKLHRIVYYGVPGSIPEKLNGHANYL